MFSTQTINFPPLHVLPSCFLYTSSLSKSCSIGIDLEQSYYSPGECFNAKITLQGLKSVKLQKLRWHLYGAELVHWETIQGSVKNQFHELNEVINEVECLFDYKTEEDVIEIDSNFKKEWNINYYLPCDLPPSFSTSTSCIIYYLRVMATFEGFENIVQHVLPFSIVFVPIPLLEEIKTIKGNGITPSPTITRRYLGGQSLSHINFTAELFPCLYLPPNILHGEKTKQFSIAIHLNIESHASFPLKEITFILTQITKLQIKTNQFVEKDNLIHYIHKFDSPIQPNSKRNININIPIDINLLNNPGKIVTKYITNQYILSICLRQVLARCEISLFTAPRTYLPKVVTNIGYKERDSIKKTINPKEWDINQVGNWLLSIEMEEFIEYFLKEEIDGCTLLELTEDHLKELKVEPMSKRIKLMKHIKKLPIVHSISSIPIEDIRINKKLTL